MTPIVVFMGSDGLSPGPGIRNIHKYSISKTCHRAIQFVPHTLAQAATHSENQALRPHAHP